MSTNENIQRAAPRARVERAITLKGYDRIARRPRARGDLATVATLSIAQGPALARAGRMSRNVCYVKFSAQNRKDERAVKRSGMGRRRATVLHRESIKPAVHADEQAKHKKTLFGEYLRRRAL